MIQYLIFFVLMVVANLTSHYLHGLIYCLMKADKYEDTLALKIKKAVIEALDTYLGGGKE